MKISPDRHREGVALVITLSLLLVVTVIVTAFFFRSRFDTQASSSYSGDHAAQEVAQGALANVVSGLLTEAATSISTGDLTVHNDVIEVTDPIRMLPSRAATGSANIFPTLIKQSIAGTTLFPGSTAITPSSVASIEDAANRSGLDGNFWNKPKLTVTPLDGTANSPNWIYVSGDGGSVTSAPTGNSVTSDKKIVARYAFNVYDTGGLLDINVAGGAGISAYAAGRRGGLASVNPDALPGASGLQAALDSFRSDGSWTDDRLSAILKLNGLPISTGTYREGLDVAYFKNAFLSRQDLLSFSHANGFDAVLPYLTVFSRDVDVPYMIWNSKTSPGDLPPKSSAFPNSASAATNINVPPWKGIGDTSPFKSRFPLDRLALLGSSDGGPTGSPSDILTYFGLTWDGPTKSWKYPTNTIKTLDQIPAGVEPNFFETLKAAISVGSLGRQAAPGASSSDLEGPFGLLNGQNIHLSGKPDSTQIDYYTDLQIFRIGANIIDQWDYDGFPTRITVPTIGFLRELVIFGVEDLPYLHAARESPYAPTTKTKTANGVDVGESYFLLQPQLWNPHSALSGKPANLNGAPATDRAPTSLRLTPWSASGTKISTGWHMQNNQANTWSNAPYGEFYYLTPEKSWIGFTNSPAFRNPIMLLTPSSFPGFSITNFAQPQPDGHSPENEIQGNSSLIFNSTDDQPSGNRTGFVLAHYEAQPFTTPPKAGVKNTHHTNVFLNRGVPLTHDAVSFALQYESGGNWYTYDIMSDVLCSGGAYLVNDYGAGVVRPDPRTDRFSSWGSAMGAEQTRDILRANKIMNKTGFGLGDGNPFFNSLAYGAPGWSASAKATELATNNEISTYKDSDGITRPASGYLGGNPLSPDPQARPIVLNRPFQSVGELAYVFRDSPWRNLELYNPKSGDAGLLEYFCIHATNENDRTKSPLRAGVVNINSALPEVLAAVISGASANTDFSSNSGGGQVQPTEAKAIADKINDWVTAKTTDGAMFRSRAEIVGRFDQGNFVGPSSSYESSLSSKQYDNQRSVVSRALSDVITTSTWNLMIDVVAQSGMLPKGNTLDKFVVTGQSRYWLHIAIDRTTGKIVDQRLERVF